MSRRMLAQCRQALQSIHQQRTRVLGFALHVSRLEAATDTTKDWQLFSYHLSVNYVMKTTPPCSFLEHSVGHIVTRDIALQEKVILGFAHMFPLRWE